MDFAEWLEIKIRERGTNATKLAEAIKENQPTIYRILSGQTKNPTLRIIKKLEAYFADENREPLQYNVKDFSKYTDKLNNEQNQRLEELISYFVVLNDEHQKDILKQAGNLHSLQSRLNQIMRRRDKPKVLKDDIHERRRKKA